MKKSKIKGITNLDDSIWLKLEGTTDSLNKLDLIFNIFELMEHKKQGNKNIYKSWIKNKTTEFLVDDDNCLAYIILTQNLIHIILRKIRNYEKVNETIEEYFEF